MPATTKRPDPLAALLDAQVDAQHAGIDETQVSILIDLGYFAADFLGKAEAMLAPCPDARMVTSWVGCCERRQEQAFSVADALDYMLESTFGEYAGFPVIQAAARLRAARGALPVVMARAA